MTFREYIMLEGKSMSAIQFHYYCKDLQRKKLGYEEDDFDPFAVITNDEKGENNR